jgi:hypothetical protein
MTIAEEMYILSQMLENWMTKRSLTYEMQQSNYINLTDEEIQEYYSALDIYEQIDALCDILVFSFNSVKIELKDLNYENTIVANVDFDFIIELRDELSKDFSYVNLYNLYKSIRYMLLNLDNSYCEFDLFKAMVETYKEINSRTGAYNPVKKKWIKFETPEAMKLWYKADYKSCAK